MGGGLQIDMLDEKEFDKWCKRLKLSDRARAEIEHIRASPPARRVQSRIGNVTGHFNRSRKMGHSIQSESRTVEKAAIIIMELHDNNVLELWDQPPSFIIHYKGKGGRNLGHPYTADFFVLRRDAAGWEEWKPQEVLLKLAEKNSEKYYMGEDGKWHCPPAERYAQQFGLYHHVHSSAEISWVLIRNLNLLMPCYVSYDDSQNESLHQRVGSVVNDEPGITMANLLQQVEGTTNGDILGLIVSKKIYVDLEAAFLGEPEKVQVFRSQEVAILCRRISEGYIRNRESSIRARDLVPGSSLLWENNTFKVLNTSKTKIYLRDSDGTTEHYRNEDVERFITEGLITGCQTFSPIDPTSAQLELEAKRSASDDEIIAALDREQIVLRMLKGERVTDNDSEARKHRNWLAWYKEKGLAGLIFHPEKKGNNTPRLDSRVSDLMNTHIKGIEKPGRGTLSLAYGAFRNACEARSFTPCSAKTFRLAFNARKDPEQTEKIEGSRAAYQEAEPIDSEHYTLPVNGDRPWQYVHIDHTVVDLELRHSEKPRKKMGRVWITLMIDAYSRRILAFYFSFDSPSRISLMMVLRECVRKHGRLPECIVTDNGKEFKSVFFEKLLARYGCDIQWRPPSQPRFGAIMERFIKTMNIQFVHELVGNTKIMAMKIRLVTKAVNPKNLAVWNLPLLEKEAEKYFYEEYDQREHSALGQSPKDTYDDATEKYNVPYKHIQYNENFIIDILPSTAKGTAKVVQGRGVKIWYVFYNNSRVLKAAGIYGKQVEVRFDPWNRAIAYAYIKGKWVTLQAPPDLFYKLQNLSHRELRAFSEELRQLKSLYGKNFNARMMEMAERHATREALEKIQKQRQRDDEKREAAHHTGRYLSVEDFRDKSTYEQKADYSPESPSTNPTNTARLRTFDNLRRHAG
jgi:transposase InsO family protein